MSVVTCLLAALVDQGGGGVGELRVRPADEDHRFGAGRDRLGQDPPPEAQGDDDRGSDQNRHGQQQPYGDRVSRGIQGETEAEQWVD